MKYTKAEVKFNSGTGARLCNACGYILSYGFDHTDTEAYCEDCYGKLYNLVYYIANDYIELSQEKVRIQRDDYMRLAQTVLRKIYEE